MAEIKLKKKLIYAGEVYQALLEADPKLAYILDRIKPVDAEEVVRGRWLQTKEPLGWQEVDCIECSACHESWMIDEDWSFEDYPWRYCPNCGACMDAEVTP